MAPRPEKTRHLYRSRPENRLKALRKYYEPHERADLQLFGKDGVALLIPEDESMPYSCFKAGTAMIVLYGFYYDEPTALGYLTLKRLSRIKPGSGARVRSMNERFTVPLSAGQVERLRSLAYGTMPRPGARSRVSPFAARLVA